MKCIKQVFIQYSIGGFLLDDQGLRKQQRR